MGPTTNTGKTTNSQLKVQSFFFDASDPTVAFTNGFYDTGVIIKNNALIYYSAIKYMQDVTGIAYTGIGVEVFTDTAGLQDLHNETLPNAHAVPNQYLAGSNVPGGSLPPTIGNCINNNNVGIIVALSGITTPPPGLSFMFVVMYVELDF
jgi:hypothetical protein